MEDKSETRLRYDRQIYEAQDFIQAHLAEDLDLEKISRAAAFSPFHFHRIFKSIAGETVHEFITRKRLEKACALLFPRCRMKITEVALSCGFSTPSSFAKAFKHRYGITPTQYTQKGSQNSKMRTVNRKLGKEDYFSSGYRLDRSIYDLYEWRKKMKVRMEEMPAVRTAYMRRIGAYGEGNFSLMGALKKWALGRGLMDDESLILGMAQDDPEVTPPEKCRYDAAVVIPEKYEIGSEVSEGRLPGGKYAVFSVSHTAEAIGRAWNEIFSIWLPDSGYQIDNRPLFERYTGQDDQSPLEPGSCDICVPVKGF